MTRGREIDDRKPPVRKREARGGIDPHAGIVGPAMRDRVRHAPRDLAQFALALPERFAVKETCDAAHGSA